MTYDACMETKTNGTTAQTQTETQTSPLVVLLPTIEARGRAAFALGVLAAPVLDLTFLTPSIRAYQGVRGATAAIFGAWSKGWHAANMEAAV